MIARVAALAATCLVASPRPAHADWYGWQTYLSDSLSGILLAGAAGGDGGESAGAGLFGFAGYLLAPPILHLAHDSPLHAGASLGARIVVPLAAGSAALKHADDRDSIKYILLASVAAVALVDGALAFDDADEPAMLRIGGRF